MRYRTAIGLVCLLAWALPIRAVAQITNRVTYSLLEGSYFIDDCPICDRLTIEEPLRGTFDLVLLQNTPPYSKYSVQNIQLTAGPGFSGQSYIAGEGIYERFEEFAVLQDMTLSVLVTDDYTNKLAFFTNQTQSVQQPFPLIQANLQQTNGTLLQTFSMHLLAAPLREIWFSTSLGFISTNRFAPTNQISGGDLIANTGRIVQRNSDLVGQLGIMPLVSDLGLDAAFIKGGGEILFSLPVDVFSETLGWLHHGDLLSNRGHIVKRNQDLLAAFNPVTSNDAGLDAAQILPTGEILFSIQSNVVTKSDGMLSRGDILSDTGGVFRTHQQLLANFQPAVTNHDFGLDALYVFPSGEIWFSVEEGFTDNRLGAIQSGDLLSSLGYRAFSNQGLLSAFAPASTVKDYGLDALFIVTDTAPPQAQPLIVKTERTEKTLHLEWNGEGAAFQVETAPALSGPWSPFSPILPDTAFDGEIHDPSEAAFFRLRQW